MGDRGSRFAHADTPRLDSVMIREASPAFREPMVEFDTIAFLGAVVSIESLRFLPAQ